MRKKGKLTIGVGSSLPLLIQVSKMGLYTNCPETQYISAEKFQILLSRSIQPLYQSKPSLLYPSLDTNTMNVQNHRSTLAPTKAQN
jgi:hypothetical protein